jgi:ABC-type oligopeptide transport system substrate-binding subunit
MKKLSIALALSVVLATAGCAPQQNVVSPENCVTVIVDFQSLKSEKTQTCITAGSEIEAMTAFNLAGYSIAGTDKYGLQVVCRINGLPDAKNPIVSKDQKTYVEKCTDMPAEFAYWSLLIRTPEKDWTYAPVGIADLKVNPGEQVALVFSVDEKLELPN